MGSAERAEVDVDLNTAEFHARRHEHWAELRKCPVAYSTEHGGFWVVSGYDEVKTVSREAETFSSEYHPAPKDGLDYLGICGLPRSRDLPAAGIAEGEWFFHQTMRRVLNPFLLPPKVKSMEPFMEATATWFMDQKIEDGEMDLVLDFTNPVPAVLTMKMIGLPCADWKMWADLFHAAVAYRPGSPDHAQAMANLPAMMSGLLEEAAARRVTPADDMLTALVQARVDDDRPLRDEELLAVLWNLVGGGLDTTTSLTSLSLHHLDQHPELRRQLIEHPELLPTATEEFLRYFSVNETLTRTVTSDTELGGQDLRRGDFLVLSWLSANRDGSVFERPDDVVLDRSPNPHLAFGIGPYRCIGMHVARTLFQILMTAVLTRIPDYAVDRGATRLYQANPQLAGVVRMPASYTPGPRVGPAPRPF